MAKSNKRARFAIDNLFNRTNMTMNPKFKRVWLRYLDHDEVVKRTSTVIKVLKEQKERKCKERLAINWRKNWLKLLYQTEFVKKKTKPERLSEQIQYGFDLANWMMLQHE